MRVPPNQREIGVDLEQFYNEDARRRHSEELEFGRDWTNEGERCEIAWVEDTGELYAMVEPVVGMSADGLGGLHTSRPSDEDMRVDVLGVINGRQAVEAVMSGWEAAMPEPNSLAWVRNRVANAASELNDPPAS